MSADILGTSWDQCRSMVQYSFTSTRLVWTDSPGRPPRLSHSSWTMTFCSCRITHPGGWREVTEASVERGSPAPDEGECHKRLEAPGRHVSRFGLAVRRHAGKQRDLGSNPLRLSFLFKSCGLWNYSDLKMGLIAAHLSAEVILVMTV